MLLDKSNPGLSKYDIDLVLGHGIIRLKQRTKSYVNKQLKWIRRRFVVDKSIRNVPSVYRLDTTQPELWESLVRDRSLEIVRHNCVAMFDHSLSHEERSHLVNNVLSPLSIRPSEPISCEQDRFISGQFKCDVCQIWISGGGSFEKHMRSKKHAWHEKNSKKEKTSTLIETAVKL